MYQLIYYCRTKEGQRAIGKVYEFEKFRLRRNALHYLFDVVQTEYREKGYATEVRVGALYCYKSVVNDKGERRFMEILIKVVKA